MLMEEKKNKNKQTKTRRYWNLEKDGQAHHAKGEVTPENQEGRALADKSPGPFCHCGLVLVSCE